MWLIYRLERPYICEREKRGRWLGHWSFINKNGGKLLCHLIILKNFEKARLNHGERLVSLFRVSIPIVVKQYSGIYGCNAEHMAIKKQKLLDAKTFFFFLAMAIFLTLDSTFQILKIIIIWEVLEYSHTLNRKPKKGEYLLYK